VSELKVKLGIDDFLEREEFKGKRLGLLTNSTGINGRLKQNIDLIVSSGFNLVKLFGPEHGISGAAPDGVGVGNAVDPKYGIPVYSLFGEIYRPTEEMLSDLDFFVYDIQDVGLRFYTYIYSLAYSMEECARKGIKVIVLDRPNPLSCKVEGPTIKRGFETFVGGYGLALRYGLTVGELARYYNAAFNMGADLEVVPMENYDRNMYFDETGHPWNTPSPNIPSLEHALLYTGFCLFEGTNLSLGRGTVHPFKYIGAPWIDPELLYREVSRLNPPGVAFRERSFIPAAFRLSNTVCHGLEFFVTDKRCIEPLELAIDIISTVRKAYPEEFEWDLQYHGADGRYHFDLLMGECIYRQKIEEGATSKDLVAMWTDEERNFEEYIKPFRIY
jgi:uncharacterized protein YbbC (DUF1343 family)